MSPGRVALYVTLALTSLLMVVPFAWMVLTSLKTPAEIASEHAGLLPSHWEFGNYVDAFKAAPFATYARNSFVIAISHTVINVLVASMVEATHWRGSGSAAATSSSTVSSPP